MKPLDWLLLAFAAFLLWHTPDLIRMNHEAKQWRAIERGWGE